MVGIVLEQRGDGRISLSNSIVYHRRYFFDCPRKDSTFIYVTQTFYFFSYFLDALQGEKVVPLQNKTNSLWKR